MTDKELVIKGNRNPLKFLGKIALPIVAAGLGLSNENGGKQINEVSLVLPSDTSIPIVNNIPSFQDAENQVIPIETPEIAALKDSIANKFGIEIQTFDDISKHPEMKIIYGFENLMPINQEWNEKNLELLTNVLKYVPSDFYKPRNGEKIHVILGPTSHCGHDVKGFTPKYPYEVMLSYSLFKPEKPLTAILVVTHEFGHLITTDSCNSPLSSNYTGKIEEITGQDFEELQKELPVQIEERADRLGVKIREGGVFTSVDSLTPEEEKAFRLTRLNYAAKNSKEFMALLFESYFMGKEYFYRMYIPFFGSKTDGLYDLIKDIYQGREFPDYQITKAELDKEMKK